jgi:ATP-dependent metalloprotease FtsH
VKNLAKNWLLLLLIFLLISSFFAFFGNLFKEKKEISFTQLVQDIAGGKVKKITVSDSELVILYLDNTKARSRKEAEAALSESLLNYGLSKEKLAEVEVETKPTGGGWLWLGPVLFTVLPLLLFGLFFWFIFRQAKTGAGQVFDFTRIRPRLFGPGGKEKEKVSFNDIGGLKEAKEELKEVVDFLKNPKKYLQLGAKIPRGVLLIGAPGTGKTLLAKAIASSTNVPFFSITASEVIELFVGVGASCSYDTNVLIRTENSTKLLPIGEFVDQFYPEGKEGYLVPISGVKTLGYEPLETRCWGASKKAETKFFEKSCWQNVKAVYRHKANEIYEIHYLGGKIRTTGDHSLFVRHRNFIKPKKVSELKPGEILVGLLFKVKGGFVPAIGTTHKIKAHQFEENKKPGELWVWNEGYQLEFYQRAYEFALAQQGQMSQKEIGAEIGVPPSTIGLWQRGVNSPQYFEIAARMMKKRIPQKVSISPNLLKLLGYYTAEGRREDYYLQFVFGSQEKELHRDCINLMAEIFGVKPHLLSTEDNSLRITYHSKFLGDFFEKHCGSGSHKKHIPEFLWDLPKEYFLSYLDGFRKGDGYTSRDGKLIVSSVSKQLILELTWLSAMQRIKVGVGESKFKGGRIIRNKPLPEGQYWILTIGKTSHPFEKTENTLFQFKKPIVKKIIKKSYNGYVYDLCGCENEAFFGGEKPILLHNSRIRSLFEQARKTGKAIIFVDEIDSIGKVRGVGVTGGHEEREQTLNQLLAEMDGIGKEEGILVFAATNRPEFLDPALLRPGRFDRRIILDLPDINEREDILKIHCRGKPLTLNVNLREVAERTPGFSGADLANVVNEAAILAARRGKNQIFQEEFLESIEKVLLGPERKSHILTKKEKEITAYHEAGHALVSTFSPGAEPVRKISIVPRGLAAGYTLKSPKEERRIKTKSEFLAEITTLIGGYCAEKLKFGEITTGAANDLERATELVRKLVKEYGMSSLGPISFGERFGSIFLGREFGEYRNYSEKMAEKIDKEVEKFVRMAEKLAEEILAQKKNLLEKIARILMEREIIEKEEFEKLIGKKEVEKIETSKPWPKKRKSIKVKIRPV